MRSAIRERPPAYQAAAQAISAQGFAEIDIDPAFLAEHVPRIRDGMRDMTDDPSTHETFAKQILRQDEMGWDQEAGLVYRDDAERKFFFHYQSPPTTWPFPDMKTIVRFAPFFESCSALTAKAWAIARLLAYELEHEHGPLAGALADANTVTRVLRYLPLDDVRAAHADAYAHLDRGFLTIHWWASEEGLMIFDRAGAGHRVAERAWDRIAIFPGKKFFGMTGGALGMAGIHGVRDPRTVRTDDRIAVVTFVHASLSPEAVACMQAHRQAFKDAEARCTL